MSALPFTPSAGASGEPLCSLWMLARQSFLSLGLKNPEIHSVSLPVPMYRMYDLLKERQLKLVAKRKGDLIYPRSHVTIAASLSQQEKQ